MKVQRTSIGLDVHARSVVGCGLDGETGQLFERRLIPDHGEVLEWIGSLPAPVTAADLFVESIEGCSTRSGARSV